MINYLKKLFSRKPAEVDTVGPVVEMVQDAICRGRHDKLRAYFNYMTKDAQRSVLERLDAVDRLVLRGILTGELK